MYSNIQERYGCTICKFFTNTNSTIKRHYLSKKHIFLVEPKPIIEIDPNCEFQCKICNKKYKSNSGLWKHNQTCKLVEVSNNIIEEEVAQTIPQLSNEIKELKSIIIDLVKNQQPSINITNNINNINVFLNEKCGNACNLVQFMEKIQFKGENFERFIMDYVNGNMEVIEKNFKMLPEFERPIYCFEGEDNHQSIAHIQHDNKWVVEPEISWERKSIKGQDETDEEDNYLEPNSMYSLVRMFDKKKLDYFNKNYNDDHLYLKCRKLERDTCNPDLQILLMKKIVEMATINPIAV